MTWIVPALVAIIAFGGQFAASLWSAGAKVEKFDSISVRVTEIERRVDHIMTAESTRDMMQARLEERLTSVVGDLARVHSDIIETNRHLTAIEDFLYRKGAGVKDAK